MIISFFILNKNRNFREFLYCHHILTHNLIFMTYFPGIIQVFFLPLVSFPIHHWEPHGSHFMYRKNTLCRHIAGYWIRRCICSITKLLCCNVYNRMKHKLNCWNVKCWVSWWCGQLLSPNLWEGKKMRTMELSSSIDSFIPRKSMDTGNSATTMPNQSKSSSLELCRWPEYAIHWVMHVVAHNHDDVIKWKYFPRYWPFVWGIQWLPVNSPHKGQWRGALMFSLICALNKQLNKQSWGWWLETPSCS